MTGRLALTGTDGGKEAERAGGEREGEEIGKDGRVVDKGGPRREIKHRE